MNNKVKCDKGCGEEFDIKKLSAQELHDDVTRIHFNCEHCQQDYTTYYTDITIVAAQIRLSGIRERLAKSTGEIRDKLVVQCISLNEEISRLMRELRLKVEGQDDSASLPN